MNVYCRICRILITVFVSLIIFACSGGNGDFTKTIHGQSDVSNAEIWIDTNNNFEKDPNEPDNITSESGAYSINLPYNIDTGENYLVIKVESGKTRILDRHIAEYSYLMIAPADSNYISIWTTIQSALAFGENISKEDALYQIINAFSLPEDFRIARKNSKNIQDLKHILQTAYAQESERQISDKNRQQQTDIISIGKEIMNSSKELLDIYINHLQMQQPPLLQGPSGIIGEDFHGDFSRIPFNANMYFGVGLDEASYELVLGNSCVDYNETVSKGLCSNSLGYNFNLIQSVDELSKHFSVGASATAGVSVAGFDIVSVSGGFKFLKNTEFKDNYLYVLLSREQKMCNYNIHAGLTEQKRELYNNNYEEFRNDCGDRFLTSLTTGGYFKALIELKVDVNSTKKEMELDLSGKVLGATVYDNSWKDIMRDINNNYDMKTRVVSNFFTYSDNYISSVEQVFEKYDEFVEKMKNMNCSSLNGWKDCSYTANFAPYERIANSSAGNKDTLNNKLQDMTSYENYYFKASDTLKRVSEILSQPDDYNLENDNSSWNIENLSNLQKNIREDRKKAITEWESCKGNIYSCTDPGELNLVSLSNINLPAHKYRLPETCEMLSKIYPGKGNGFHYMYVEGIYDKYYNVYCKDMLRSKPKTYLILENTSENQDSPIYNYSSYHYKTDNAEGDLHQTYKYLRVEPAPPAVSDKGDLRIISPQNDFTEIGTNPAITDSNAISLDNINLSVLEAKSATETAAEANLNLEGTSFKVIADINQEDDPVINLSKDNQSIDISVTDGTVKPFKDVLLKWSE